MRILLWGCYFRGVYVLCGPHWINAQVVTSTGFKRFKGLKVSAARITPRNKLFCLGGIFVSENFEARIFNHFKNKAPPPNYLLRFSLPSEVDFGDYLGVLNKEEAWKYHCLKHGASADDLAEAMIYEGNLIADRSPGLQAGQGFFPNMLSKIFSNKV